jgi:hypothetical protein
VLDNRFKWLYPRESVRNLIKLILKHIKNFLESHRGFKTAGLPINHTSEDDEDPYHMVEEALLGYLREGETTSV